MFIIVAMIDADLEIATSLISSSFCWQAECETLSIKQDVFADLEKSCTPHCIFASSSSAFSLKSIGERTKSQDRIAGIHFFW